MTEGSVASQGKHSTTIAEQFSTGESLVIERISHSFGGKKSITEGTSGGKSAVQHSDRSCSAHIAACAPVVQRLQRAGHVEGRLGGVDPCLRRLYARLGE